MKVLNVDDKAENRYMLEALLRGHGHTVDSASNGFEALQLAERGVYDIIVSDILMPRMDGFQFCRELRKDPRLRHVPLIFYTATYTDPKDAAFALGIGANRFLVKPLEPEIFLKNVEEVIEEHRGQPLPPPNFDEPEDESIYLKEYNTRLIAKLEKKMLDLEQSNRALQADIAEREHHQAERAKLEQQLRQAQKMEAVGTLAGGIAHDFNNILSGIVGFSDLAQHDAASGRPVDSHLKGITKACHRARTLIEHILAFSRHREQTRRPLKLASTINDALELLRATLPASIVITTHLDADAPPILADETQIHQVLTNLVTNAWHAIDERGGKIDIQIAAVLVDAHFVRRHPDLRAGRYVRLSVTDTGSGIDGRTLERIFEPFFTTKETGRGSGLGLAVVHGIVKTCDGGITVHSKCGQGTTFHVYFPALETESPITIDRPLPLAMGHGERVLFIDDEPVLTTVGERFLTRLGYQPVTTNKPLEGLELFGKNDFALVITDLTMPLRTGIDLGREMLELRPDARIILSTGYSASLDRDRVVALGFRDLLLKPYNAQVLGECIQRALA